MIGKIWRAAHTAALFMKLEFLDRRAGRQLELVQDRRDRIGARDIILVACLRNELPRMPAFVAHYRRLGVRHFLLIDNGSTDGFQDWAASQEDVSVWHTEASYRESRFGMLWCNDLLRRHARKRWCVVVDPDEFLVFPYMETRDLRDLATFLEDDHRYCAHALLIDAYSDKPLAQTVLDKDTDPFEICAFFDREGYVQSEGWDNSTWIRGGPRLRSQFGDRPDEAPALNKIPFIRWQRHFHYRNSTHDVYPRRLNQAHERGKVSLTAALFHFKLVASLKDKAAEEAVRNEHYEGGREYARYQATEETAEFYREGLSVRYSGPQQLVNLGLMSPGRWF